MEPKASVFVRNPIRVFKVSESVGNSTKLTHKLKYRIDFVQDYLTDFFDRIITRYIGLYESCDLFSVIVDGPLFSSPMQLECIRIDEYDPNTYWTPMYDNLPFDFNGCAEGQYSLTISIEKTDHAHKIDWAHQCCDW